LENTNIYKLNSNMKRLHQSIYIFWAIQNCFLV
jgi:hypothetical protein